MKATILSPLPFGVLSPGHAPSFVQMPDGRFESPLPFGVLSPGHHAGNRTPPEGGRSHHCLSAFCPPATSSDSRNCRTTLSGHHCLSAFCPPATSPDCRMSVLLSLRSPLPFGVLSPGHLSSQPDVQSMGVRCHHCLSAFCPPATFFRVFQMSESLNWSPLPFGVLSPGHRKHGGNISTVFVASPLPFGVLSPGHVNPVPSHSESHGPVTIAFRRSVPRPRRRCSVKEEDLIIRSPLPFGVLSPGHVVRLIKRGGGFSPSPLPFGVLSPGHALRRKNRQFWPTRVTIAFRRSVPRPPPCQLGCAGYRSNVTIAFRRSVPRPHWAHVGWCGPHGNVTIAFRRSVPRPRRLPNCMAGRGRRAVQVTTAAASQFGSRWSLPVRRVKLHKVLRYGKLKFRSGPPLFSCWIGPDLEP